MIYYYNVKIYKNPSRLWQNEFKTSEFTPLAENEDFIVFNDRYYTKIAKTETWGRSYHQINKSSVAIHHADSVLKSGVFYTLYSEKPKRPATIKKEITAKLNKEMGFLTSIDLSIIK